MAFIADDRVREASTTTGTGALSLGGAVSGYRAFSSVMADGDTCQYAVWLDNEWETGIGTYGSSGNTLTRTTVLSSSNSGSAVNFSAGSKQVVITLGARPRLGHPVFVPAGSVSAPALTTHDDDNTGVFFPSSDTIAFAEGGVEAMRINSSGDVIVGNGDAVASPAAGTIRGTNGSGTNIAGASLTIRPGLATGNAATGSVIVQTAPAGTSGTTLQTATERLRINATGEVIAGNGDTAAAPAAATIRGTNGSGSNVAGANLTIQAGLGTGSATGGYIRFMSSVAGASGSTLRSAAEVARFDTGQRLLVGVTSANANGGVLQLKSGITFPATAVSASDANTLDDYEEGTWTPAYQAGSSGYVTQIGQYTRIGNVVTVYCHIQISTSASFLGTSNVTITGWPLSPSNSVFAAVYWSNTSTTNTNVMVDALTGYIWRVGTAATSLTQMTHTNLGNSTGAILSFQMTYRVA